MSIYAGTNTLYVGSQDGTATLFPVLTIRFFSAGIYIHDHVQHTNEWVQDENGPRWIRRIAALEPSSTWPQPAGAPSSPPPETKTMCDCCAAARTIRELEKLMADDKAKTPPTNDDVDHYFPALINATGGQRLIMPS